MIRPLFALALALSLVASMASAQSSARPLVALTQDEIDPARLLPPPPADGSPVQRAELAELRDIQAHRTIARLDQAQWDQDHQNWVLYAALLGPKFDMKTLPATAKVLAAVQNDMGVASGRAKLIFMRKRPWASDPAIKGCTLKPDDQPLTSYPSGHTTDAYALGVVLADLMPDKAQAILARANDYAYSRMVCGMHYRSDTVAGQALGTLIAVDILHSPKMQASLADARSELKTAGLTGG